jgi:hypothetical protein
MHKLIFRKTSSGRVQYILQNVERAFHLFQRKGGQQIARASSRNR